MSTLEARSTQRRCGTLKVLIVDDEHYTRKVIRTLLLAIGCTKIYEAGDGASGLEMIRAVAPDVVLLDWEMPGIDGAGVRAPGALARIVSATRRADHHADRPRRALARARGGAARRARIPAQAGVERRAAGAHPVGADQAAHDGPARRLLRAGAAQARDLQAGGRQLRSEPDSRRPAATPSTKAAVDPDASHVIFLN